VSLISSFLNIIICISLQMPVDDPGEYKIFSFSKIVSASIFKFDLCFLLLRLIFFAFDLAKRILTLCFIPLFPPASFLGDERLKVAIIHSFLKQIKGKLE